MDVPNQTPIWPSAAGPNVPDFHTKLQRNRNLDMDSALACLRRELAAMQLQDINMHNQLLAMRSSICGLKDELKSESESERWEMETQQDDRADLQPAPGYVAKVEIIRSNNHQEELRINHVKQDSGILTDEERSDNDEELEESVQQMLKTFPPAVKPRSSSFSATAKRSNSYLGYAVKLDESEDKKSNKQKACNVIRVRARSVAGIEIERLSSVSSSPRRGTQTFIDGTMSQRFGSMPVINEIPSDDLERNAFRSKTFAVYGYRRSDSVDENARQPSVSISKKLPAFGSLTRHSSMPVMYSRGRPTGIEFRSTKERDARPVTDSKPTIKRSTSQIILSRPAFENIKETDSNKIIPYRMYRSSSQVSLV